MRVTAFVTAYRRYGYQLKEVADRLDVRYAQCADTSLASPQCSALRAHPAFGL